MPFEFSNYLLFCAGALALIASPGPDFFYVFSRALSGGRAVGVVSALGIGAGLMVHTMLASSGLTLLLFTSPLIFAIVKWLGALYLLWMGIKMLRGRDELTGESQNLTLSHGQVFRQGILTNVFNPKVALTFAAFLPPFVHPDRGHATLQIAILGATLCSLATLWFCGIGLFAGQIGALLTRRPRLSRAMRLTSGTVLVLLGVRLGLASRS